LAPPWEPGSIPPPSLSLGKAHILLRSRNRDALSPSSSPKGNGTVPFPPSFFSEKEKPPEFFPPPRNKPSHDSLLPSFRRNALGMASRSPLFFFSLRPQERARDYFFSFPRESVPLSLNEISLKRSGLKVALVFALPLLHGRGAVPPRS